MGLLDTKSSSKNVFSFDDKTHCLIWLDKDNMKVTTSPKTETISSYDEFIGNKGKEEYVEWNYEFIKYEDFKKLIDVELNQVYPFDMLIDATLAMNGYNKDLINDIRVLLMNCNLLNELDRQYLNMIGFKEEDLKVTKNDMFGRRLKHFHNTYSIVYLFQYLLMDANYLSSSAYSYYALPFIVTKLEEYGYKLPKYDEYLALKAANLKRSKVIDSKSVYSNDTELKKDK